MLYSPGCCLLSTIGTFPGGGVSNKEWVISLAPLGLDLGVIGKAEFQVGLKEKAWFTKVFYLVLGLTIIGALWIFTNVSGPPSLCPTELQGLEATAAHTLSLLLPILGVSQESWCRTHGGSSLCSFSSISFT